MPSWFSALPAFAVTLLVFFAPGGLIASLAGARGLRRWALAAPITFTIAGVGAILLEFVGVPFTLLGVIVLTMLVAIAVVLVRLLLRRRGWIPTSTLGAPADTAPADIIAAPGKGRVVIWTLIAAGFGYAAAALGWRIMAGIGGPESIAQLFDNVFHLNAVHLITDTGVGSSLILGNLTEASRGFYPAALHDIAALIVTAGGFDVPTVLNTTAITLAAVVWPISAVFLTTRLFGARPAVVVLTAVLAPAIGAFPYRLLSFGVLYPFHAALVMLPVVLALLVELFGAGRVKTPPVVVSVLALIAVVPGVALAHPSAIVAALVFSIPFVIVRIVWAIRTRRDAGPRVTAAVLIACGVYAVGTLGAFLVVRPPLSTAPWDPSQSNKEALGAILSVSPSYTTLDWALLALCLIGIAGACMRLPRYWPILALYGIGAALYFASAALPAGGLRDLLSGVWYRDTIRLSALLVIAAFPLLVLGALTITRAVARLLARLQPGTSVEAPRATILRLGAAVLVALVIIPVTHRGPMAEAQRWLGESYGQTGGSALVDEDERALLDEVADLVPADGVVVGNPVTGASLVYALGDRKTLAPHIFGYRSPDEQYLLDRWDEAGTDPKVCEIIERLGAYWALDFGSHGVLGESDDRLPGTDGLSEGPPPGITEIARVGDVALFEATACGPVR